MRLWKVDLLLKYQFFERLKRGLLESVTIFIQFILGGFFSVKSSRMPDSLKRREKGLHLSSGGARWRRRIVWHKGSGMIRQRV